MRSRRAWAGSRIRARAPASARASGSAPSATRPAADRTRVAASREKWIATAKRKPSDGRDQDPEQHLLGGDEEVAPQQRAIVVERLRDQRGAPAGSADRRRRDRRTAPRRRGTRAARARRSASAAAGVSSAHPQRLEGLLAERDDLGSVRRRGRRRSTSISATARPGRGDITTTRSASTTASSTSWVTSTTVRGSLSSTCASQPCISARVIASRAANGSSSASTGLPASSERRNETRWRIPPDSSAGRVCSNPPSPNALEPRRDGVAGLRPRTPVRAQGERRVVDRASPRAAAGLAGASAPPARPSRCPRRATAGRRSARAASSCRSRSGPTTATISPGAARRDMPCERVHLASLGDECPAHDLDLDTGWCHQDREAPCTGASIIALSLPPRALPHRFEGSAPGRSARALSQPAFPPAPLGCQMVRAHATARATRDGPPAVLRDDRAGEGLDEILELVGPPALERRAVALIRRDHAVTVIPVEPWLGIQPATSARPWP